MNKIKLVFLMILVFVTNVSLAQFGTLDATFDGDGKVFTTFDGYKSSIRSLAIQPDLKIIAAGNVYEVNSPSQFALARYNSNGSPDEEFGNKGKVVEFSKFEMVLQDMVLQPDGKILVLGVEYMGGNKPPQTVLMRYESNGILDDKFGSDGKVSSEIVFGTSLLLLPDGKIIIAGYSLYDYFLKPDNHDLVLARYDESGTLDLGFGSNGIVITPLQELGYKVTVALQSEKIIVVSDNVVRRDRDFLILRYHPDGTLDTDFGTKGMVRIGTGNDETASSVKIQSDRKIVIAGSALAPRGTSTSTAGPVSSFLLVRLLEDGGIDNDFGKFGMVLTNIEPSVEAEAVALQSDGKILIAGIYWDEVFLNHIIVTRYHNDGTVDQSFGIKGSVIETLENHSKAFCLGIQFDERIVVGGNAGDFVKENFILLRYNSGLEVSDFPLTSQNQIFQVYPNPVNETVNLDFILHHPQGLSIDLYDMKGIKIQNVLDRKGFQTGYNSQTIELPGNLTKGIYFLNISNGSTVSNIRIVK